jgi:hypothetical protein
MDTIIPRSKIPLGWDVQSDIANFYLQLGRRGAFDSLTTEIEPEMRQMIAAGDINWRSYRNPYLILLQLYELRGDKERQLELLQDLQLKFPNDPNLKQRISAIEADIKAKTPAVPGRTVETPARNAHTGHQLAGHPEPAGRRGGSSSA